MEITLSCTKMPCLSIAMCFALNAAFDSDLVSEVSFSIDMRYCSIV